MTPASSWQPHAKSVIAAIMGTCRRFADRPAFIYRIGTKELTVDYAKLRGDVILLTRAFEDRKICHGSRVL
ncbi:MAG: hypothetical protein JRE01_11835, partial [Deltaproteobacteria bacterium]|nr:hypothetical protein [Deltaproteobacteria bacterium]